MKDKLQVLVVDDDRQMVKTICDILQLKGHGTIPAHSGEEAVAQVLAKCPDCVLMDIKMPGIDGVETLKKIKLVAPNLPVVLVTGYRKEMTDAIEQGLQVGAYTCLYKPLAMEKLFEVIEEIGRQKLKELLEKSL